MREILGRRRRLLSKRTGERSGEQTGGRSGGRPDQLGAALTFAKTWQWPVLPGAGLRRPGSPQCACPDPDCAAPGGHPFDPGILAATSDERMVRWWWANRPTAPVLLATGGPGPSAVSLPAIAAARSLAVLDRLGVRVGPVVATPDRWSLLVAPYSMPQLGELLYAKDHVPGSLRFHGSGGYLVLPPSDTGRGEVRWERAPLPGSATPWLPDIEAIVDVLVDTLTHTGVSAPEF